MSDNLIDIGAGAGAGGVVGWVMSYLKHREIKQDISERVSKDTCMADRHSITQRFDAVDKLLDKIDTKIDKLFEPKSS